MVAAQLVQLFRLIVVVSLELLDRIDGRGDQRAVLQGEEAVLALADRLRDGRLDVQGGEAGIDGRAVDAGARFPRVEDGRQLLELRQPGREAAPDGLQALVRMKRT